MDSMQEFSAHMQELLATKTSQEVAPFLTQYSFWLYISIAVFLVVMILAAKKVKPIPQGFFSGGIEHLMDWFYRDVGVATLGANAARHMPFIMTIFFFVLISNLIGLIPGTYVATGTIGVTIVPAVFSFVYYHYYGVKTHGARKYLASFAPKGVVLPMRCVLWVIEVFSNVLRLFTLAIRLFANMYAGHLVLGAFALLTSVFLMPLIQGFTMAALSGAAGGLLWMLFLILMYCMELMMACIQAYVFSLLSAVYIQLAVEEE